MTNPLPSLARADRRQRSQNAADVSPTPSAASPSCEGFKPAGPMFLAAIAHIPVPKVVKQ